MVDDLARVVGANGEHLQILVVDHQQRMIIRAEQRLGWICRHDISRLAGVT
jgi:predicted ATPase